MTNDELTESINQAAKMIKLYEQADVAPLSDIERLILTLAKKYDNKEVKM
jgi:hypothetical protein